MKDLKGVDFLCLQDFQSSELEALLTLAKNIKQDISQVDTLHGKIIGLVFEKPSARTRVSLEVAIRHLNGSCIYLAGTDLELGKREPIPDTAHVLDRYLDGIAARVYSHDTLVRLSDTCTIPIINALSDLCHPMQILADLLTVWEYCKKIQGVKISYIGDGNNVCNSLLVGCSKLGINLSIACPKGYDPDPTFVNWAHKNAEKSNSEISIVRNPFDAVKETDIIYTDTFVSMGFEAEKKERLQTFLPTYKVSEELLEAAGDSVYFMHPLPCHRGEEVDTTVIDGSRSIIWDQAENRLHTAEALLSVLI